MAIDDPAAHRCLDAERAFLGELGGGCELPVGAYALAGPDGEITLEGLVASLDGLVVLRRRSSGPRSGRARSRAGTRDPRPLRGRSAAVRHGLVDVTVYLVGAGPGDPKLITVRGAELLSRAGAVVHDRLVDPRLLSLAPPDAELLDVAKRAGDAGTAGQEAINALLVELGRRHEVVVRLHGGDPFVFGRGGEEALAVRAAGIGFEVVAGVSSATGVLASGGVPVTHRGVAASFTVVTGHAAGGEPPAVDWEALARLGGTLVVLMGVARRGEIAGRLLAAGRLPATPVAVIESGTLPAQRTSRTTLGELAAVQISPPATIVIGEVAALDLAWFETRPLFGWRIVVTRARAQASTLVERLAEVGAESHRAARDRRSRTPPTGARPSRGRCR